MFAIVSKWVESQLGQIVLGGAVLGVITKFILIPFGKLIKVGTQARQFILHELNENSGRSMRDYMVRNDARIEYLFEHQGITMPDHLKTPPPLEGHDG